MVACRSCGRNIASGTIRCSKCSTPFHLSCSHKCKISPEGVFNVCCGPNVSTFPRNPTYHLRTRKNKRKQEENVNVIDNVNNNASTTEEDTDNIKYAKHQKIEEDMGISDKPVIDNESDSCSKIIEADNNENNTYDENDDVVEVLDEPIKNEVLNQINSQNIVNNDENKITLETVWQGISVLQTSISNISNSLDTVSNQLNTFDPRINELETTLNTIKTKTSAFENVQNDVNGMRNEVERITTELESLKSSTPDGSIDFSEILIEIKEREMKSRNILIYNVPEDNLRISQDYSTLDDINQFNALVNARDNSRAREILGRIPNIDLDEIDTRRLGRAHQNNYRPLRVTLQSKEDVITVMRSRGLIHSRYNVKTDLTRYQQRKIKELKEELNSMNNPFMTIKFVSGEPKIIPIRRNIKHE